MDGTPTITRFASRLSAWTATARWVAKQLLLRHARQTAGCGDDGVDRYHSRGDDLMGHDHVSHYAAGHAPDHATLGDQPA